MDYDFEKLYQEGKINKYFYDKLNSEYWKLIGSSLDTYLNDAIRMSSLGISNAQGQALFFRLLLDVPDVYYEIVDSKNRPMPEDIDKIIDYVFVNRHDYPFDSLVDLFCAVGNAANKLQIPLKNKPNIYLDEQCSLNKSAYPVTFGRNYFGKAYDINRWMQATRDIYNRIYKNNEAFATAFDLITSQWDKVEKTNYKHWLRFYNEGVPSKYPKLASNKVTKLAQFPLDVLKADLPTPVRLQLNPEKAIEKRYDINDTRAKIENQRLKIINRLNAAEKLLCSLDGQLFAGEEQEFMLKLLQDLKRKVQTANKISIKSTLFEDYIHRTGNYLRSIGNDKGAKFFKKIAQDASDIASMPPSEIPEIEPLEDSSVSQENTEKEVETDISAPDSGGSASISVPMSGGIPATPAQPLPSTPPPGMGEAALGFEQPVVNQEFNQQSQEVDVVKQDTQQAFREFFELLDDGVYDPYDDPDELSSKSASFNDADIIVTAQEAQLPLEEEDIRIAPAEVAPIEDRPKQHRPRMEAGPEESIVVEENEGTIEEDNTDDVIDAALNNITIDDAIKRLEMLVSIYKKREISRQLSILDIMMDRLGLGAFFPSLGEAMAKSLESNQYISTRIEEVLNKLKGSVESVSAMEWVEGTGESTTPQSRAVSKHLKQEQEKEKHKKKLRREMEEARLTGNSSSGVGQQAENVLSQPVAVEQTQKPIVTR